MIIYDSFILCLYKSSIFYEPSVMHVCVCIFGDFVAYIANLHSEVLS